MENLTNRQRMIIKYSLIIARNQIQSLTSYLFMSENDIGFQSLGDEVADINSMIDLLDEITKTKQK